MQYFQNNQVSKFWDNCSYFMYFCSSEMQVIMENGTGWNGLVFLECFRKSKQTLELCNKQEMIELPNITLLKNEFTTLFCFLFTNHVFSYFFFFYKYMINCNLHLNSNRWLTTVTFKNSFEYFLRKQHYILSWTKAMLTCKTNVVVG